MYSLLECCSCASFFEIDAGPIEAIKAPKTPEISEAVKAIFEEFKEPIPAEFYTLEGKIIEFLLIAEEIANYNQGWAITLGTSSFGFSFLAITIAVFATGFLGISLTIPIIPLIAICAGLASCAAVTGYLAYDSFKTHFSNLESLGTSCSDIVVDIKIIRDWKNRLFDKVENGVKENLDNELSQKLAKILLSQVSLKNWDTACCDVLTQVGDSLKPENRHFYGKNSIITRVWTKLCLSNENPV